MYLLDTNVLSELYYHKPLPAPQVLAWMQSISQEQFYIAATTIMELEIGVLRLERRTPPQGQKLRNWLQNLKQLFAKQTLVFDAQTAEICAAFHVPNHKSERDSMIAATALQHDLMVVTRNVADFQNCGVKVVNPWDERSH